MRRVFVACFVCCAVALGVVHSVPRPASSSLASASDNAMKRAKQMQLVAQQTVQASDPASQLQPIIQLVQSSMATLSADATAAAEEERKLQTELLNELADAAKEASELRRQHAELVSRLSVLAKQRDDAKEAHADHVTALGHLTSEHAQFETECVSGVDVIETRAARVAKDLATLNALKDRLNQILSDESSSGGGSLDSVLVEIRHALQHSSQSSAVGSDHDADGARMRGLLDKLTAQLADVLAKDETKAAAIRRNCSDLAREMENQIEEHTAQERVQRSIVEARTDEIKTLTPQQEQLARDIATATAKESELKEQVDFKAHVGLRLIKSMHNALLIHEQILQTLQTYAAQLTQLQIPPAQPVAQPATAARSS